jgi:hypothetical protein
VHRDSAGHDLCWHQPALWSLLPERTDPLPRVRVAAVLRGCIRYRQSLDQLGDAPRSTDEFGPERAAPRLAAAPATVAGPACGDLDNTER